MEFEQVLLLLHIAGVLVLVAGAAINTATGVAVTQTVSLAAQSVLLSVQRVSSNFVLLPGVVLVVVFGTWLVSEEDYDFGSFWISAAYTLTIVILALDHGIMQRTSRKARARVAELTAAKAADGAEVAAMLNTPLIRVVGVILNVSFLAFLYLMIDRPGA